MNYMTIEEVAELLGCSVKTVRRYTKAGLRAYRVGKRLLFIREEVETWVKSRSVV